MMVFRRFEVLLATGLMALLAAPAGAFSPPDVGAELEVKLRDVELIQSPVDIPAAMAATRAMTARYGGGWSVYLWNATSETPQTVFGTGVDLAGTPPATDAAAAAMAAAFLGANGEWLGARPDELEVERVVRGAGKVAVHYGQRYHGLEVVGARVKVVMSVAGRLELFGSSAYRGIEVSPDPVLMAREASEIARAGLPFNPATDRELEEPVLLVLPVPVQDGVEHHLAWRTVVGTQDPYGQWVTCVDALDGKVLWRYNDVHFLYSGTVQGDVDQSGYCDGFETSPFRNMTVSITGLGSTTTGADGSFSIAGTGGNRSLNCQFAGTIVNVNDVQFGDSNFNGTIEENVPLTINWTDASPSRRAERDAFYWVNETNAYVKSIDPAWSIPFHTANVNVNDVCNANWGSNNVMNFFRAGGGCANTGTIGDVVAHEYGHGIQYYLLTPHSQGNQGLGEGNGDISGTFMSDDPLVGRGFNLNQCGNGLRTCLNTLRYPENVVGAEIHDAGRVICGFNWDARQLLETKLGAQAGEDYTAFLWHFSRKLLNPFFQPDQVMAYFLVDDDDGNIGNGSPNYDELCEAAENHGFTCPTITEGVTIDHTPLADTTDPGPYTVSATITAFGPHPLDTSSPTLYWSVNAGPYTSVPMSNAGGDVYEAQIPGQGQGAAVAYYLTARTDVGIGGTSPHGAPEAYWLFGVGTFSILLDDDVETDRGWTLTEMGGNNSSWERADPNGTYASGQPVNPEDDHTADPGVICWVTGNPPPGSIFFLQEVDGRTTIVSPTFDMSGATMARLSVWLWAYMTVTTGEDHLDLEVSTNGGASWTLGRRVAGQGLNAWNEYRFTMTPFDFAFTSQVKFRFVAEDGGADTILDCGMDDFNLRMLAGGSTEVSEGSAGRPGSYVLYPSRPNPFNPHAEIHYVLASGGQVRLHVYDATGRELRVLVDEVLDAGEHVAVWDGRDASGAELASGTYFYKLEAGGKTATRRMTLLK